MKEDKWLEVGDFELLKPNQSTREIAGQFDSESDKRKIEEIISWIHERLDHRENSENFKEEFNQRSVNKIIDSGYYNGCSDVTLIFITLARLNNIPTKWVYLVDSRIITQKGTSYTGHSVAKCYFSDQWNWVDPNKIWGIFWSKKPEFFEKYYEGHSPEEIDFDYDKMQNVIEDIGNVKCYFYLPDELAETLFKKAREEDTSLTRIIVRSLRNEIM